MPRAFECGADAAGQGEELRRMSFEATPVRVEMRSVVEGLACDGHVAGFTVPLDSGKTPSAPNPVQLLLVALGACTAMDVISLLRKKRLELTRYEVLLSGQRQDEHPRIYTRIEVLHRVWGRNLPRAAVEHAAQLSHDKYCTVSGQIGGTATIEIRIEVLEPDAVAPS